MRAVRAPGGRVEVADVAAPVGADVRVHVRSAGICGSDLHLVALGGLGDTILGHEIAGVTDDGTAVAVEPVQSCQTCVCCLRGDNGQCADATLKTMGIGLNGGMAEQVLVPEHLLVPLPPAVALADAGLVEPLAVAVRALARVGVTAGDRIVVIGGGSIGLCVVAVARYLGAEVELVARHDNQRAAGDRLGAVAPTGRPAAIVIEAAGTQSALADAVDRCAPGGRVGIPGSYWEPVEMPGMTMGLKEVSLVPSVMYGRSTGPRDVEVAADVLAADPEIGRALITHRFPLDGAVEAFAAAADRASGAIKVVLEPVPS